MNLASGTASIRNASVRAVEEASLNAWPSLQQMVLDGWLLRFAQGYTRRANSVNPIYPGQQHPEEKIDRCQSIYQDRGQPCIFKITPLVHPGDLDQRLADRGYQRQASTSVQLLDLTQLPPAEPASVQVWQEPTSAWLDRFVAFSATPAPRIPSLTEILQRIPTASRFFTLHRDGDAVACGMAVLEGRLAGLFDVVTKPAARGQGLGTRLLRSILSRLREEGARTAYLQVMDDNQPARRLYARLGFQKHYTYWYRVLPLTKERGA